MTSPTYLRLLRDAPRALPEPLPRERKQRLTLATLLHADTVAVEFMLSCISIFCGVWILLPFSLFVVPFEVLARVFSETACGLWLLVIGAGRLGVLWHGRIKYRQYLAFLMFVTWLNLLSWVVVVEAQRMSVVFFAVFAAMSFWVFLRGPSRIQHRVQSGKGQNGR